jgi:hypothetical protein
VTAFAGMTKAEAGMRCRCYVELNSHAAMLYAARVAP